MNPKERNKLILVQKPVESPIFCPAIYEHKAKLIGKAVSEVAQNAELLCQSVLAEYEIYRPDMLTVGIDIYNIEAQAIGCGVVFPDAIDAVPAIDRRILNDISEVERLTLPNPEKTKRMPLILEATQTVNKKLGSEVYVRAAISGPYSIAVELLSIEPAIMAMMTQPNSFAKLMDFCTDAAVNYGCAIIKRGLEVCIFDSYAAPPLVSPQLYHDMVLPYTQKLVKELKAAGAKFIECVVGGDTSVISDSLFLIGADIILSDFVTDASVFIEKSKNSQTLIRRNISPILIENGPEQELKEAIGEAVELANKNNFIIGTGVLSYNTSIENVLAVKQTIFGN